MPAKVTEYTLKMNGVDGMSGPVDHAGRTVDTFAGKLSALRREASASGDLGAERLFKNPERLIGLLTGQGLQLAIAGFAFRELGNLADAASEHIDKVRKGTEGVTEALMGVARSIPLIGEAVKAGEAVGKLITGRESAEEMIKAAQDRDAMIAKRTELIRRGQDKDRLDSLDGFAKRREEVEQEFAKKQAKNSADRTADATKALEELSAKQKELAGINWDVQNVPGFAAHHPEAMKRQTELNAEIGNGGLQKLISAVRRPYDDEEKRLQRELDQAREAVDRQSSGFVESQMKSEAARANVVKESEEKIRAIRQEFAAEALESFGFTLQAKLTRIGAEADQKADEIKKRLGMAMQDATQSERIDLGQQMNRELDANESTRAGKAAAARTADKAERAKAMAERMKGEEEVADHRRTVDEQLTRWRIDNLKEQAVNDPRLQRTAQILEMQNQFKLKEQEYRKELADSNISLGQRLQIMGLIKGNASLMKDALKRALIPGSEPAKGFELDTNVGKSFYAAPPTQEPRVDELLAKLVDNTDPTSQAKIFADAMIAALKATVGVYSGTDTGTSGGGAY